MADLHLEDWKKPYLYTGDRVSDFIQALKIVQYKALTHQVPVLFAGDLFHKPKSLSNKIFDKFITNYVQECKMFAISGNHDQSEKNTLKHESPSYVRTLHHCIPNFKCVDNTYYETTDFIVAGIPYLTHNKGFLKMKRKLESQLKNSTKLKILLIHRDLPGAKTPVGYEVNESDDLKGKSLKKVFKNWDLVLVGHIHKPQELAPNVFMLGSPLHQDAGDADTDMGYWIIYEGWDIEFVPLNLPKFKYLEEGKPFPDQFNIYIPVDMTEEDKKGGKVKFSNKMNKTKVAKNYLKEKGIKDSTKRKALIKTLKET